jgi:hypothetical protein
MLVRLALSRRAKSELPPLPAGRRILRHPHLHRALDALSDFLSELLLAKLDPFIPVWEQAQGVADGFHVSAPFDLTLRLPYMANAVHPGHNHGILVRN